MPRYFWTDIIEYFRSIEHAMFDQNRRCHLQKYKIDNSFLLRLVSLVDELREGGGAWEPELVVLAPPGLGYVPLNRTILVKAYLYIYSFFSSLNFPPFLPPFVIFFPPCLKNVGKMDNKKTVYVSAWMRSSRCLYLR